MARNARRAALLDTLPWVVVFGLALTFYFVVFVFGKCILGICPPY